MPAEPIHKAILSLGSNISDRAGWLTQAAEAISGLPSTRITARSSIYETEAVDVPAEFREQAFLNAVLIVETALTAKQLSKVVHQIEDQLQRTRDIPNQPRTIDIDIITFDNLVSDDKELTLPHPRTHLRRFVLQPLSEIEPKFILPDQSETVSELLCKLPTPHSVKLNTEQWS